MAFRRLLNQFARKNAFGNSIHRRLNENPHETIGVNNDLTTKMKTFQKTLIELPDRPFFRDFRDKLNKNPDESIVVKNDLITKTTTIHETINEFIDKPFFRDFRDRFGDDEKADEILNKHMIWGAIIGAIVGTGVGMYYSIKCLRENERKYNHGVCMLHSEKRNLIAAGSIFGASAGGFVGILTGLYFPTIVVGILPIWLIVLASDCALRGSQYKIIRVNN